MRAALFPVLLAACEAETPEEASPCDDPSTAPAGVMCTIAGRTGYARLSEEGLPALQSEMYLPIDMTVGPDGLLYLLDWNNHRIRRLEADGTVHTLAGTGFLGDGPEGNALQAAFNHPTNLKFHPDDPSLLYIAAWHNSRIEVLDLDAGTIAWECGSGERAYGGDGGPAMSAHLDLPSAIVFDDDGTFLLTDTANQIVRRVNLDDTIETVAGTVPTGLLPDGQTDRRYGWEGDGGDALAAKFNFGWGQRGYPGGRAERFGRTLYLADTYNFVIRALDLDSGALEHVAGTGLLHGYAGDGGPAAEARFEFPADIAADPDGNLYIADVFNHCVRRIDTAGQIDVVAGVCTEPGAEGDGGPATEAHLLSPYGVEVANGVLYIADTENHVIRAVRL
jgi:hypothetical protein